ncbi:MAG TPA: tRNA pseudouridine(55) synthase TruB [Ginsengibacter sp.]|nr:tRNA pseudouridine(55) synthase TruB [Ginsengibacter sp.]
MEQHTFEEGKVILIDKPLHWTSFDVVKKIRNVIKLRKIGHAGTLDPLATGLLILCTGKFTKKINDYMAKEKEYVGSFTLGATTPTYDLESDPVNFMSLEGITEEQILHTTEKFLGEIMQVPPSHSAVKQAGKPVYLKARKGEDVQLEPRRIIIKEFEISDIELPVVSFRVVCSTATYIRSLAHDFGKALGCGAYLSGLKRTAIGALRVEEALDIEEFVKRYGPK